jgi:hypothetical protein
MDCAELRVASVPNPPSGGGFTFPITGAAEVEVMSLAFLFTASAGVANRSPSLDILDPLGAIVGRFVIDLTITASNASQVTFAEDLQPYGANNSASMGTPIPKLRLYSGMSLAGSAVNIAAGDQLSAIRLFVKQWPTRLDAGY